MLVKLILFFSFLAASSRGAFYVMSVDAIALGISLMVIDDTDAFPIVPRDICLSPPQQGTEPGCEVLS